MINEQLRGHSSVIEHQIFSHFFVVVDSGFEEFLVLFNFIQDSTVTRLLALLVFFAFSLVVKLLQDLLNALHAFRVLVLGLTGLVLTMQSWEQPLVQ